MTKSLWYTDAEVKQRQDEYQKEFDAIRAAEREVGEEWGCFGGTGAQSHTMTKKERQVWQGGSRVMPQLFYDLIDMWESDHENKERWGFGFVWAHYWNHGEGERQP